MNLSAAAVEAAKSAMTDAAAAEAFFAERGFTGHRARRTIGHEVRELKTTLHFGMHEGKPRCSNASWGNYDHTQCSNRGTHQDAAGRWWCGTHAPETVAKRKAVQQARDAERQEKWAASRARQLEETRRRQAGEAALEALRQIEAGHNDPRALAREVLSILEGEKPDDL